MVSQELLLTPFSSTFTIVSGQPLCPSEPLPTSTLPLPARPAAGQRITVSLLSSGL